MLVRAKEPPGASSRLLGPPGVLVLPPLFVLLAMLVAAGPLVRRIRALTREVRASTPAQPLPPALLGSRDELGELARSLDASRRALHLELETRARSLRALREFLDNTTHDLAIPLAVLHGHVAALADALTSDSPASRQDVEGAVREAHYIRALLGNLAMAARLDAGEPEVLLRQVDLCDLVDRVVERHRIVAEQEGVAIERALPPERLFAEADVTMLEQAVSNIVLNAVRHNRRGGHAAVLLEAVDPRRFRVRTLDDGPGMSDEELARVTARGIRGNDAVAYGRNGQGLGLAITSRVASLHGFELRLGRASEGGLEVCIEGPRTA